MGCNAQILTIVLVCVLALALGGQCASDLSKFSNAEQERERAELREWEERQEIDRSRWQAEQWIEMFLLAGMLVGAGVIVFVRGLRWATTIYPNGHGMFPLLFGRVNGLWAIHDPNSKVTVTMGGLPEGGVEIGGALAPGLDPSAGSEALARAQGVQAIAASTSAEKSDGLTSALIAAIGQRRMAMPLPPISESPWSTPHVERLLLKEGQIVEGET
jgi:hypothetical protein